MCIAARVCMCRSAVSVCVTALRESLLLCACVVVSVCVAVQRVSLCVYVCVAVQRVSQCSSCRSMLVAVSISQCSVGVSPCVTVHVCRVVCVAIYVCCCLGVLLCVTVGVSQGVCRCMS